MIDGFPMDDDQAQSFVNDIGPPTAVILFEVNANPEVNDRILEERLRKRYVDI